MPAQEAVSPLVLIVLALIGAVPATIAAWASLRRGRTLDELRDELQEHAEDDAAFQEWIVSSLELLRESDSG